MVPATARELPAAKLSLHDTTGLDITSVMAVHVHAAYKVSNCNSGGRR